MTPLSLLIRNAHLYGPVEDWNPGWLLARAGKIALLGPGRGPDFLPGEVAQEIDAGGAALAGHRRQSVRFGRLYP